MKLRFLTLFVILAFGVSVSAKPKAGQVQVRKSQARKPQARKSQIHKPQPTISSRLGRYRCIYDFDRIIGGSDADTVYLLELKPNGICRVTDAEGDWKTARYRMNQNRLLVYSNGIYCIGWFSDKRIIFPPEEFWGDVNSSGPHIVFGKQQK